MTSIYSYKGLADFRQFIRNLVNKLLAVSDALAGFREVSILPKRLGQLTVEQVTTKTELIEEIYEALKKMKPETHYKLPYDKKEREREIISNVAETYQIDLNKSYCEIKTGYHKDNKTGQQFPWAIEIAIAQRKDLGVESAGRINFIGSVNDTPAIDGGEKYFQSDQYAYRWTDRNKSHIVRSAKEVLNASGFDSTSIYTSRKRHASVVYVNVKTDVPDWLGAAGKTHMNQLPYAETIAATLSKMSHKIDSYRGQGFALSYTPISSSVYQKTATDYVDEFLTQRRKIIEADPYIRVKDRLTQRGVAYRRRPKMIDDGFEPKKNWATTMDTMTNMISDRCKVLWPNESIDREYLGIYAKARGMFYYRGAYVANLADNTVSIINTSDESVVTNITVGHNPTSIAVNPETNIAYVASYSDNIISVVDGDRNVVLTSIKVGINPYSVTVNPNSNLVYVAHVFSDYISVIRGETNSVMKTIPLQSTQRDISINPNTDIAYATFYEHNILGLIDGLTNTKMVGINFNINPSNAGKIVCNDKEIVNNGYMRIDVKDGNTIVCQSELNSGFIFSSWSGTIMPTTSVVNHTGANTNSNFLSNPNFLSPTAKNNGTSFKAFQNGTLTANFLNPIQVTIPTEALLGIILSPFVGWLIPYIAQWKKDNKQSNLMNKFITNIYVIQSKSSKQTKDEYLKSLSDLKEEITDAYSKGKINQSHYDVLSNKISENYEEIYSRSLDNVLSKSSKQTKDEYLKSLSDLKEEITDAYSKGKINQSHYDVLTKKLSQPTNRAN